MHASGCLFVGVNCCCCVLGSAYYVGLRVQSAVTARFWVRTTWFGVSRDCKYYGITGGNCWRMPSIKGAGWLAAATLHVVR